MSNYNFVVYGNNVAALVSALELSKNHKIALINPTPNWGGHFAGMNIKGVHFDIGMNLFEFTTFHKQDIEILTYDPWRRNDSARFFKIAEKYICSHIETVLIDKIEVLSNGVFADDIIMSNSFNIFKKMPNNIVLKIKSELEDIVNHRDKTLHASNKRINEKLFLNTNYYEVSIENHGITFHELFIEPFCKKIFNISSKDFPSLFHRIAWLPLFYPETLLNGINGKSELTPTLFYYPQKGNYSEIINTIFLKITKSSNITLITQKPNSIEKNNDYELNFEDKKINTSNLIWCNDLQNILDLAKFDTSNFTMNKASLSVVFCTIDFRSIKRQFSVLYITDNGPLYRITNQDYSSKSGTPSNRRFIFEFNLDVLNEFELDSEFKIIKYLNRFLIENNILSKQIDIENLTIKNLKNVVNLPTSDNLINFELLYDKTQKLFPGIELLGPASSFVSTSFNDQVIQGLKIGKKYN